MAQQRDQLFTKEKFDAYMSDHDDEDASVGSARGSIGGHSRLGGLSGLRPVKSSDPGGLGGLGGSKSGLGGMGGSKSGIGGLGGSKPGLGGFEGSKLGGLGGLGGSYGNSNPVELKHGGLGGLKASTGGGLGGLKASTGGGLGGLKASTGGGLGGLGGHRGSGQNNPPARQLGSLRLEDRATIHSPQVNDANVEALKSITSVMQALAESTIMGFKEVSSRLNQKPLFESAAQVLPGGDMLTNTPDELQQIVKNIDEKIANKTDEVYIIIPGHETKTLTTDEAIELLTDKSVRIFGGISQIASITSKTVQVSDDSTSEPST